MRIIPCPDCDGRGHSEGRLVVGCGNPFFLLPKTCDFCGGKGIVKCEPITETADELVKQMQEKR